MDRIRKAFRRVPIPAAFIICSLSCLLVSVGLTKLTVQLARKNLCEIEDKYEVIVNLRPSEEGTLWTDADFQLDTDAQDPPRLFYYYSVGSEEQETEYRVEREADTYEFYSDTGRQDDVTVVPGEVVLVNAQTFRETDRRRYEFFRWLDSAAAVLWYSVCLGIAAAVFYFWKVKKPFRVLNRAVRKIAGNDLDCRIEYEGQDEFGRLCHAFEVMRRELVRNNRKMWDSVEERKRLNAAFSHDLRTPLTVLRGHVDLLCSALSEKSPDTGAFADSVQAISRQITRLDAYVSTMGTLQRLEDYEPCVKRISSVSLEKMVYETGTMLFPDGEIEICSELGEEDLGMDQEAFASICENLLSNAARYARNRITVSLRREGEGLIFCVEDDGPGFTEKDLENASLAYYRGERTETGENHFGLGLYICQLLAEKLGGTLRVENGTAGGKVTVKIEKILRFPQ